MSTEDRMASLFQSILCPVDFSKGSRIALQHGVAIANCTGGRITVMYADDPLLAAAAAYNHRLITKQTTTELRRLLKQVDAPMKEGDPRASRIVCAIGKPAQEILKVARRSAHDLIVMGTEGRSGAGRMFFGSVTEEVLRRTTVPVLAVPAGPGTRGSKSWPGNHIVCAVELGPLAREDVLAAARVAKTFKTDLTLIHAVAPNAGPPWRTAQLRAHDRDRLKAAGAKLEELARYARTVLDRVEWRTLFGNPAEEISAASTDLGAGLILLTLRRGHGLFGVRQGTVTYRVLCGAAIPVLALHQNAREGRKR